MSFSGEEQVKCECGEEFESVLWSSINAKDEPALKEEILAGQLNVVRCPRCREMIYAERFLLYHDAEAELMAFVYPKSYGTEREAWIRKTERDFAEAQGALEADQRLAYPPMTVFGMDELVEVLNADQERSDEGDIMEALSASLRLEVRRLPVSFARAHGVPSRLPLAEPGGSFGDRLGEGLRRVLASNDRLAEYAAVLARLKGPGSSLAKTLEKGV